MNTDVLSADSTVADALDVGPHVAALLNARRTACVGCYLARFCTLRDTAAYYDFPLDEFINELRRTSSEIIVAQGGTNV